MLTKTTPWLYAVAFAWLICASGAASESQPAGDQRRDFRQDMRHFVEAISSYAKQRQPQFAIVPQNGVTLLSLGQSASGKPALAYLNAIDAIGQEDLRYGYSHDDVATAAAETRYLLPYLQIAQRAGKPVFVTDYCSTAGHVADAVAANLADGMVPFAADSRELDRIPALATAMPALNGNAVQVIHQARNFLYLLNPSSYFNSQQKYLAALHSSRTDLLLIDPHYHGKRLPPEVVAALKHKPGGARRQVLAYLSIGEAEDYRHYWRDQWSTAPPAWLGPENPHWPGNFRVRYWHPDWQSIIMGHSDSSLDQILAQGFDGVYLDIIDAYEYYEQAH